MPSLTLHTQSCSRRLQAPGLPAHTATQAGHGGGLWQRAAARLGLGRSRAGALVLALAAQSAATGSAAAQEAQQQQQQQQPPLRSLDVAVIGAGAAGLMAARELLREGHRVRVYEKGERLGGVWAYTEETEDDPLGTAPGG